jgi:hypothetical protein
VICWWLVDALAADPTPPVSPRPLAVVAVGDGLSASVAVVADCLDERSPSEFTVIDRTGVEVASVLALEPKLVLVGLTSPKESDPGAYKVWLDTLLGTLGPGVPILLVELFPPDHAQWRTVVGEVGKRPGILHIDAMTGLGPEMTDQAHASVGAAVCDAVMTWRHPAPP